MSDRFYLMNKDTKVLLFESQKEKYGDAIFKGIEKYDAPLPRGVQDMGGSLNDWLRYRKAPGHRKHIKLLLEKLGAVDLQGFIEVSHALSLNDTFWVKPADEDLTWDQVSLYQNDFNDVIAQVAFDGFMSDRFFSSPSPELSTDGAYAKCWKKERNGEIYLIKKGNETYGEFGSEPYSEYYASQIAEILCPKALHYDLIALERDLPSAPGVDENEEVVSKCKLFTTEDIGFIAFAKLQGNIHYASEIESVYDGYGCLDHFRRMLILDAIILNTDRHQGNHGFLIRNETQDIIGAAPIFDHNQSLLSDLTNAQFEIEADRRCQTKTPKIGFDFIDTASQMVTPKIKTDLLNLRGFTFKRHPKYNLPEKRIKKLEQIVSCQIDRILENTKV